MRHNPILQEMKMIMMTAIEKERTQDIVTSMSIMDIASMETVVDSCMPGHLLVEMEIIVEDTDAVSITRKHFKKETIF